MQVDVRFKIERIGKTYKYPYESVTRMYSIDGQNWFDVNWSPFEHLFPKELEQKAFAPDIKLKRGQLLIFEEDETK